MPDLLSLPFWLHVLVETPASLKFFFHPTLGITDIHNLEHSLQTRNLIRQYAFCLLSTVVIALIFATRVVDETSQLVAAALAVYHVYPVVRATVRLRGGQKGLLSDAGGPVVHLIVHGICLLAFVSLYAQDLR